MLHCSGSVCVPVTATLQVFGPTFKAQCMSSTLCELSGTSGLKYQDSSCQLLNPPPSHSYAHAHAFTDETLIRVNSLLQQYVGTHNFHNFTSRRYASQLSPNQSCSSSQLSAQHGSLNQPRSTAAFFLPKFLSLSLTGHLKMRVLNDTSCPLRCANLTAHSVKSRIPDCLV